MTDDRDQELRVDLRDHEGETAYAAYSIFHVASQKRLFALTVGNYQGNAGGCNGLVILCSWQIVYEVTLSE